MEEKAEGVGWGVCIMHGPLVLFSLNLVVHYQQYIKVSQKRNLEMVIVSNEENQVTEGGANLHPHQGNGSTSEEAPLKW